MVDTKITNLTSRTPAVGDEIPINDISGPNVDGKITVGAALDIINGKVNVDSSGTSSLAAASTDLSDTANIELLDAIQTVTGAKTYGSAGAVGKLKIAGTTSGSTILDATAVASGTLTLPAATDTLVGKATTDTLTNKTLTSPTLTTPILGTPSSGTLTNCTGLPTAGLVDDAVTLAKMASGTAGNLITFDAAGDPAAVATGTAAQVLTSNGAGAAPTFQAVGAGSITFTDVINCVMEVPEGTVAYPDIHALATAVAKVSGFVMPDGAAASTINFKVHVPKDLAVTPAMAIRVRIMTLGAVAGPADVRLTVKTVGRADTEALDTAFTAETETTVTMPTATETMDYYQQDLTTDWAADDTITGQLSRDPTDVADDFTDGIMIVGIELIVDRTIS